MSLLIFCIVLLLITSVLELLIDCTAVAKLGIFMTCFYMFGTLAIFCGCFNDWAIGWWIWGFFILILLSLFLICTILFTFETKGFMTYFSDCILGSKLVLTPWASGSFIPLDFAWDHVCIKYFSEFPTL